MPVTCSKLGDDGWVDVWQFTGGPDKFERRDRRDEYRNDLLDANGFAHATRNNLDPMQSQICPAFQTTSELCVAGQLNGLSSLKRYCKLVGKISLLPLLSLIVAPETL